MSEILLLHHAQGRTDGVVAFADRLAAAGHTVHAPDLYDGHTFATVDAGVAHAQQLGDAFAERARSAAEALPVELVHVGWSLGVMAAQQLAQNRPGAQGLVALESFADPSYFGGWPDGLPAQVHGMADDEWFVEDRAAAEEFVAAHDNTELFVYPGDVHLFADNSLSSYDGAAAALLTERVLAFLGGLG